MALGGHRTRSMPLRLGLTLLHTPSSTPLAGASGTRISRGPSEGERFPLEACRDSDLSQWRGPMRRCRGARPCIPVALWFVLRTQNPLSRSSRLIAEEVVGRGAGGGRRCPALALSQSPPSLTRHCIADRPREKEREEAKRRSPSRRRKSCPWKWVHM